MKLIEKPELPKEITHSQVAPELLAQAVRVHLASQRQGTQSALTRAEVARTRKKYQKQKGSGNARHGDRKAPIFVGGGIAFAPKPRDYSLKLPDAMKTKALNGALNEKLKAKSLLVVSGVAKLSGKTAEVAQFLGGLEGNSKKLLIVTDIQRENVWRASRNIPGVTILPLSQINTYEVLKADKVLLMEEALSKINSIKAEEIKDTGSEIKEKTQAARKKKTENEAAAKLKKTAPVKKVIKKPVVKTKSKK